MLTFVFSPSPQGRDNVLSSCPQLPRVSPQLPRTRHQLRAAISQLPICIAQLPYDGTRRYSATYSCANFEFTTHSDSSSIADIIGLRLAAKACFDPGAAPGYVLCFLLSLDPG